jgi:amino acid transporter
MSASPSEHVAPADGQVTLRRGAIGLPGALASTLSNMAPVEGIFIVLVLVAAGMGTLTPWAFMVGALGILLTAWNVGQMGKRVPSAGSFVGFAFHGAGAVRRSWARPGAAFTFYLSLISAPITLGAVVVFLGSWLQASLGLSNAWWLVISLAAVLATSAFVLPGAVASARTAFVLFAAEAGGLALICVVVLARSGDALSAPLHATGGTPGGWSGLLGITFATTVSGFVGWENSLGMAEEIRRPKRVIPIAMLASISVIALLYLLASWAAAAGYIHWMGADEGSARLGDVTNAAPFVELADHYAPWFTWGVIAIGTISPAACYVAAMTTCTRWTYASARGGLLPAPLARLSTRTRVPAAAFWLWTAAVTACVVVPYFLLHGNAVEIAAYEAGIGTVPLLLVYLGISVLTPFLVRRRDRAAFRVVSHVLPPLGALLVLGYGIVEFVLPDQPPPANTFWVWILAIIVLAAVASAVAVRRGGARLDALGHLPEDEAGAELAVEPIVSRPDELTAAIPPAAAGAVTGPEV